MYTFDLYHFSFFSAHDSQVGLLIELLSSSYSFQNSKVKLDWLRFPVFSLLSILSLSSEIQSFTCSSLLELSSIVFLVLRKGLYISRISVWFFFSEIFHIFVQLLFYTYVVIFNSYISFFTVSLVSLWCLLKSFLSLFVSVSSHILFL
jgi:hypothetical protein